MKNCYYINHERFQHGDSLKAFEFAVSLCKKDRNIDTINLLVYQSEQYDSFISELGITRHQFVNHVVPNNSRIKILVHTVRTFKPSCLYAGHDDCEVLIAIGVPQKDLERFIDASRLQYWIIVPWLKAENISFLNIHEAIDIETNESIKIEFEIDDRIKGAIKWLADTSFPNEGFVHPNDENRLKKMANAIAHYGIGYDYDALIHHCINNGILESSAIKIATYFNRAQQRKFATRGENDYRFMKQIMEEGHEDIQ